MINPGRILFQMDGGERRILAERHSFFVKEGKRRLLGQFRDIEKEADEFAEKWLADHEHLFNPDYHDESDFPQRAFDESCHYYQLLNQMREDVRLSIIAGFFHLWEKSVRDWLDKEMWGWPYRERMREALWKSNFKQLGEFLEFLGWPVTSQGFWQSLDRCRLVVNVYKHGKGSAEKSLKDRHPEFFKDFFANLRGDIRSSLVDYRHMKVTDEHLCEFDEAIREFWIGFPSEIWPSDLHEEAPDWVEKACVKKR